MKHHNRARLAAALALVVACFAIDMHIPGGYAGWLLYFLPPLVVWGTSARTIITVALVVTAFDIAGLFVSPLDSIRLTSGMANRTAGIIVFWAVSIMSTARQRRLQRLRRQDEQLRRQVLMLDQVQDAVVAVDNEGRIQYLNAAAYRQYDIEPDAPVLGSKLGEFFRFEWRGAQQFEEYSRAMRTVGVWKGEKIHVTHAQRRLWGESVISVITDSAGAPTGIAAVFCDVTQRKQAQAALEESRERLMLANEAGGVGTWSVDTATETMEWDATTRSHWGFTPDQKLSPELLFSRILPQDRPKLRRGIESVTRSNTIYRVEMRVRRPNGDVRCLVSTGRALVDSVGHAYRIVGTSLDITEQKRTEARLRDERNFANTIFETQGALMAILDRECKIVRLNEAYCDVIGHPPRSMVGRYFWDMVADESKQATRVRLESLSYRQTTNEYDNCICDAHGRAHYVRWRNAVMRNSRGDGAFIVASGIDITDRILAERSIRRLNDELEHRARELEHTNRDLESFSYSVTHDLRSPLQAVIGLGEILMEDYGARLDDDGRRLLSRLVESGKRMNVLIDDILSLSKVTKCEIHLEEVDLRAIAEGIVTELRTQQPNRHVEARIHDAGRIRADAHLMTIALANLLGNSWKYTQKTANPTIEFGCEREDDETVYYVRDNGAGFDMRQADRLFVPFERLHPERDFAGTGVGLATVQRIINRHGGRIWAVGEPGKGAVFYFTVAADPGKSS